MTIMDSGAVRDIQEGKGRCDLMPLGVVARLLDSDELRLIADFKDSGDVGFLYQCLKSFKDSTEEMLLDVAKHFEEGAKKYGENNWQKGIPLHSYIDSAIRHYLKLSAYYDDENHHRAFVWNIMCAIWTVENKPELDDFTAREKRYEEHDRTAAD